MEDVGARGCVLAHGLYTLNTRIGTEERARPAALYQGTIGEEALRLAGPRVRRVSRWDGAGWQTWWDLLARVAAGRPAVAALPPLDGEVEVPSSFPAAYVLPPTVALRAARDFPQGVALYLGAFSCEIASFDSEGMDRPTNSPPGMESLYRTVIAELFARERRPLLPLQVPAVLQEGVRLEVDAFVESIVLRLEEIPLAKRGPVVLGGEDGVVVAAVAQALSGRAYDVTAASPLAGLERLVSAVDPFAGDQDRERPIVGP